MLFHPSFSPPLINEDLPTGPQLVFTLNNRFFRHQACYSLLPAKPGGQADRVISLCKYKVVELNLLLPNRDLKAKEIQLTEGIKKFLDIEIQTGDLYRGMQECGVQYAGQGLGMFVDYDRLVMYSIRNLFE
jgi:hypothetical protein